jgi:hypothetical protein
MIGAGQAQGMRNGAQFAIYPPDGDLDQRDQRLALVELVELGATESWAKITSKLRPDEIKQGSQAVLLEPGDIRLQRFVHVPIDQAETRAQVETAIKEGGSGFVQLAADSEPSDFQVIVKDDRYKICDPAGMEITNLRPDIGIGEKNSAMHVVQRILHMVKYRNIQELDNRDPMSPLARKLVVELAGVQADFDPADQPKPEPFDAPGNTPVIKVNEWTFLRIRNNLTLDKPNDPSRILNVTVLDLRPDWGITQIYPSGAGFFEPLDPGQEILLPLRASLPNNYKEGTDIIKVFATLGTTNFRWLELPSLDQLTGSVTTRGTPNDPLEQLLIAVSSQALKTRNLDVTAYPSREWITAQIEVHIKET